MFLREFEVFHSFVTMKLKQVCSNIRETHKASQNVWIQTSSSLFEYVISDEDWNFE